MAELVTRWLGVVVATVVVTGGVVVAAFWAPLRWGTVSVPIAIPVELVINVAALYFLYSLCRKKKFLWVPTLIWLVTVVVLASPTPEGDLILYNSWESLGIVLAGVAGFTIATMHIIAVDAVPGAQLTAPLYRVLRRSK